MGPEVADALPSGTEFSKGIREQKPNPCRIWKKTSRNLQITSPSRSMATGVHSNPCKSKAMSRKCGGRRSPTPRNESRCPGVKRSGRAGGGKAVAAAAVKEGPGAGLPAPQTSRHRMVGTRGARECRIKARGDALAKNQTGVARKIPVCALREEKYHLGRKFPPWKWCH